MSSSSRPYHHGNLRQALLGAAVETISEGGPDAMTTRGVARRAGVTHPTVTYHFGDRAGLFTVIAAEGYVMLGEALRRAQETHRLFLEVGVAYVHFAVTHRAHFEVMYRPELYRTSDPDVQAAKARTAVLLYGSDDPNATGLARGVAAWSFVHGLATLWLNGNLPKELGTDPEELTRIVAAQLYGPRSAAYEGLGERWTTWRRTGDGPGVARGLVPNVVGVTERC